MTTFPTPATRAALRLLLRLLIVLAVATALIVVELTSRSGVAWRLITFTYQANLLAAAYYAWTLFSPRADDRAGLRGAVVLYVVVAGLVWNLLLTGRSMGYTPANFLLHVVVPVLAVADWVVIRRGTARWWQPLLWLAYPAAYLGVALVVLNRVGRRAPYYFLDPGSIGAAAVSVNVAVLAAGFVGLGYLLLAVARPKSANVSPSPTDLSSS
ncbi:Pr6Pr family membrane protein [Mycobacterium sp. NPDC006124]|uniref:Pr6Pr family membrane protein n=1 Tax=Mycobacterium sp. NPDC006124 TaxID=3156729 RepID=UPI0033B050B1